MRGESSQLPPKKLMRWFFTLVGILVGSPLLGVIVGAWLSGLVAERTTDLEHRPAFLSESLGLVLEFTEFYDQQSRDFKAVPDSFYQLLLPQRKAFIEESLRKLSSAEKQTNLLEFKAARYFHGTAWLAKFEEIHAIWSAAASRINRYFEQELSPKMKDNEPMTLGQQPSTEEAQQIRQMQQEYDESIRTDFSRLPDLSDQLSKNTADLLERTEKSVSQSLASFEVQNAEILVSCPHRRAQVCSFIYDHHTQS